MKPESWFDRLLWRVIRPTLAYVWREGYKAGIRDMDSLRAGDLRFAEITVNPFGEDDYMVRRYGDADKARRFWGQSDE